MSDLFLNHQKFELIDLYWFNYAIEILFFEYENIAHEWSFYVPVIVLKLFALKLINNADNLIRHIPGCEIESFGDNSLLNVITEQIKINLNGVLLWVRFFLKQFVSDGGNKAGLVLVCFLFVFLDPDGLLPDPGAEFLLAGEHALLALLEFEGVDDAGAEVLYLIIDVY